MKKTNNKGFSLVELIVVVAIMAVLMVVLAPQYLRYVERTRLQKDNSAIAEIANAVKIAMADENINAKTPSGTTITITANADGTNAKVDFTATGTTAAIKYSGTATGADPKAITEELAAVIGNTYETSSNTYKASTVNILLTIDTTNGVKVFASGIIDEANGTAVNADDDNNGVISVAESAANCKIF